eukprot:CAMPEP_0198227182 /NCGR_PEP_ID=MMETSP1445-20131203/108236_1 /TAXON_ID=36898 /ORGANISM="Pyramimonas sp., Strain CCMP2087" /LENGTH=215 /DNA_ID=CAMNT_0043907171 /DNA_START=195 /DNA_END=845 /DNA_ORIENTATION=+
MKVKVKVIFIPGLIRHFAKGWTEEQLISGRVQTIGREVLDVEMQDASTLLQLAQAVQDKWGTPIDKMAFRYKGQTLTSAKHAKKMLTSFGIVDPSTVLLSAGEPKQHQSATLEGSGLALRERDSTQVITTTVDPDAPAPPNPKGQSDSADGKAEDGQQPVDPFSGRSYRVNGPSDIAPPPSVAPASGGRATGSTPSTEQRRALAAQAAMRRANAH